MRQALSLIDGHQWTHAFLNDLTEFLTTTYALEAHEAPTTMAALRVLRDAADAA